MVLTFLDANALVPSFTRTLLVMAAPLSDFSISWSLRTELEAERHQKLGAVPISTLRQRFSWNVLVSDCDLELDDTDVKDRPIISAASHAGADVIVTENVKDFGRSDLSKLGMSVVHPDLFLATRLNPMVYRDIMARLAKNRTRTPHTDSEIHRIETGEQLPLLAQRMKNEYAIQPNAPTKGAPRLYFRGVRCVACNSFLQDDVSLNLGLDPGCRVD